MNSKMSGLLICLISVLIFSFAVKAESTLKYSFSFNYYKDLSDTYRGGSLLSGELSVLKSWYGAGICYGYFQSQSASSFVISIDEINRSVEIPVEEMAIMKSASLSGLLRPLESKIVSVDLLFGIVLGSAKNSVIDNVYYSYSFTENRFNYLYQDYQLIKRTHFGFQFGFNTSIIITPKFGLQLNSRIQDLNNGGTFFFLGTGLFFKL